jgi:alpha-amylase/alpha-mannosidase (GH57 family)
MQKLSFTIIWNFNLHHGSYPHQDQTPIFRQYKHLFELHRQYPDIKAEFCLTGYSIEILLEKAKHVIKAIQDGISEGCFSIGSYTYAHPVLPLIPLVDGHRQILKSVEIEREVFKTQPKGLLPPEHAFDPSLPLMLKGTGIEWVYLIESQYPLISEKIRGVEWLAQISQYHSERRGSRSGLREELCPHDPIGIRGIKNSSCRAIFACTNFDNISHLRRVQEQGGDHLICYSTDADCFNDISELDLIFAKIKALQKCIPLKFVSIEDYMATHPPVKTVLLNTVGYEPELFSNWTEGCAKLNLLCDEARNSIRELELEVSKIGFSKEVKELLEQAWTALMLAENSDVRITGWFRVHPTREYAALEKALEAKELAEKALQCLKRSERSG